MPDISTITISVTVTLTIQAAYFVFMKFPRQTHKNLAALNRLKQREDSGYALYENVRAEIGAAIVKFDSWKQRLICCNDRKDGELIDRAYFRESLPELTKALGRLQGMSSSLATLYSIDPLPDFIWLFDQARRISKALISYNGVPALDLGFEISDLEIVESRVIARLEQMSHESDILQADWRLEIENLAADISETVSQYKFATYFFATLAAISIFYVSDGYLYALKLQRYIENMASLVLCLAGFYLTVFLMQKYGQSTLTEISRVKSGEEPNKQ